jgi:hypothetical protein
LAWNRRQVLCRVKTEVREFFLLEEAERKQRLVTPARRAIVAAHIRGAERRLQFAPALVDASTAPAAITLGREAVVLLVRAHVVATTEVDDAALARLDVAGELSRLLEPAASVPDDWRRVLPILADHDPFTGDRLTPAEQNELARSLNRIAAWLRARLDTRSTVEIRVSRIARLVALPVLAIFILVKALSPANLAFHKPVSQSSRWPGAADSSVLVDGNRSGMNGPGSKDADYVHTAREPSPWVMVDLGAAHVVSLVRVYNRNDMRFDEGLPFILELSADGRAFEAVATRTTHFGSTVFDAPWRVDLTGRRARFVRVRGTSYVALSELEVYGR